MDKCLRMANEAFDGFMKERLEINARATSAGALGGSRHRMHVNEARKTAQREYMRKVAQLALHAVGNKKGRSAVESGGNNLREQLVDQYETEMLAQSAWPGGFGAQKRQEERLKLQGELETIVSEALADFDNNIAGDQIIKLTKSSFLSRLTEGIATNLLTTAIIAVVGTVFTVLVTVFAEATIKLIFSLFD